MGATRPSLDYLATCSEMSLESVELSRLNLAANLRKEFQEILEEWIDSEVDARLARSLLEWKRAHTSATKPSARGRAEVASSEQLAIAFLPDPVSPAADAVPERYLGASANHARRDRISPIERAQSPLRTRKPVRRSVLSPSDASVEDQTVEFDDAPHQPSPPHRAPSSHSTELARAATLYFDAVKHLVKCLSRRSPVYRETCRCNTGGRESDRGPSSANRQRGALFSANASTAERVGPSVGFVPMLATRDNSGRPMQSDASVRNSAISYGVRSAQSAHLRLFRVSTFR
jgi:hypothetical protein